MNRRDFLARAAAALLIPRTIHAAITELRLPQPTPVQDPYPRHLTAGSSIEDMSNLLRDRYMPRIQDWLKTKDPLAAGLKEWPQ